MAVASGGGAVTAISALWMLSVGSLVGGALLVGQLLSVALLAVGVIGASVAILRVARFGLPRSSTCHDQDEAPALELDREVEDLGEGSRALPAS